jgi:hypothetical protein
LLDRFAMRGLCPCCVSKALIYHTTDVAVAGLGSDAAASLLEALARTVRKEFVPPPVRATSVATH